MLPIPSPILVADGGEKEVYLSLKLIESMMGPVNHIMLNVYWDHFQERQRPKTSTTGLL